MFILFIQWQIPSILEGTKSIPTAYKARVAKEKVRSEGEVDLFIMRRTDE
jgi:hypothetical protein